MTPTWQQKRVETLEVEVETIEGMLLWMERCEGLFRTDGEMDLHVRAVRNIASVEVQNRMKEIEKLQVTA